MDDAFEQLVHPGTIVFGVCIIFLTFFLRKLVEAIWPSIKKQADVNDPKKTYLTTVARYWNEVILYAVPSIIGTFIGLFDIPYLYGENGPQTILGRIFMGVFVGCISAFMYKTAKKRWGINLDDALKPSTRPPPPIEEPVP